jgi:hypothetical protein
MLWIKENWFKMGLLFCGIIIAYSAYSYLVIHPEKEKTQRLKADALVLQDNCRKMGIEYSERYEEGIKNSPLNKAVISPVYHYSKTLSACLVETGENIYYTDGNVSTYKFIINLGTNVQLAKISYDEETKRDFYEDHLAKEAYYLEQKAILFELPPLN